MLPGYFNKRSKTVHVWFKSSESFLKETLYKNLCSHVTQYDAPSLPPCCVSSLNSIIVRAEVLNTEFLTQGVLFLPLICWLKLFLCHIRSRFCNFKFRWRFKNYEDAKLLLLEIEAFNILLVRLFKKIATEVLQCNTYQLCQCRKCCNRAEFLGTNLVVSWLPKY